MKKILLFAAFAAMTATTYAQADKRDMQRKMDPHQRAEMQAKHLQKKLSLSDDQTRRIMEINMQTMPAPPAPDQAGDTKAMHAQRMDMMQKREAQYSQILTADQMASYRKMKEERMSNMKDMRQKHMEAPAPQP
jgi:Spy/CpxP family protein refolding chaperone